MVVLVVGLLLANAFFVGAEFAVISARRSSIEPRAEAGSRSAKTVLWAMENVSDMLACAQLGITVCSVSLGVVAEPALAHALEGPMQAWGMPEGAAHVVAMIIALVIIVGLHVVVGEMVPKNAAVSTPDRAALLLGPPLVWLSKVLHPIIVALNWLANGVLRMGGIEPRDEVTSAFTADEVHSIVERSSEEGTLHDAEGLLAGAIEFSDRTAGEVMIPVDEVQSLAPGASVEGVEAMVAETGFSRLPVRGDGGFVGYLHMKDTLFARPGEREEPIQEWRVRALPQVAADDQVESVLATMRQTGAHIAVVRDDENELGLIHLEDIIEILVGEVRDAMAREETTEPAGGAER